MATASARLPAVEAARPAARRPARTRGSSPARGGAPRPTGTGRRPCRAAAWTGPAPTSIGFEPRAELHLVLHPERPQHRRVQPPRDLRARPADGLVAGPGLGGEQQPGDLVLVLVGHQLVAVAGDGLGERACSSGRPAARPPGRRRRGRGSAGRSARTGTRRGRRRGARSARRSSPGRPARGDAGGLLDLGRDDRPAAPPAERGDVAGDGDTVELDRPLDAAPGRRRSRPAARRRRAAGCWPSWRRRTARSPARRCRRSGCRSAAGDLVEPAGERVERRGTASSGGRPSPRSASTATEPTTTVRVGVGADAVGVAGRDEEVEGEQAVDARAVGVVRRRHVAAAQPQVADDRARPSATARSGRGRGRPSRRASPPCRAPG